MKKTGLIIVLIFFLGHITAQVKYEKKEIQSLSILFMGDIMGHDTQIEAAFDEANNTYDYSGYLKHLESEIKACDIAIANLEVTLAGPPYKGYPQFSSPDGLAITCRDAGIDCFIHANNHAVDRGKQGIIRTLDVLDSLGIPHTGVFRDSADRLSNYPLIIQKNNFKIAILNYTYGTNGIKVPEPCIVNFIDWKTIEDDINQATSLEVDKIIVCVHWGLEYQSLPNENQTKLAKYIFSRGADIIIGSHPHVIQPMIWVKDSIDREESLVVYSLGNFVSNQRKRMTDGGIVFKLELKKKDQVTSISNASYYLSWVYRPDIAGKKQFYILFADEFIDKPEFFNTKADYNMMMMFVDDSRKLLEEHNQKVRELRFDDGIWQ